MSESGGAPGGGSGGVPGADDPDPPEPEHRSDGLDLARSIARAYRRPGAGSRRRTRKRRSPGTPAEASGAHPDDRDPQSLQSSLDRLVTERGWETDVAVHGMFGRWESIVGPDVAQHCRPQRFDAGELVVQADSTAWATQMALLSPTVVAKLNERLGDGTISKIVVTGPRAPSWKKGTRSVRGRGPRDTYG